MKPHMYPKRHAEWFGLLGGFSGLLLAILIGSFVSPVFGGIYLLVGPPIQAVIGCFVGARFDRKRKDEFESSSQEATFSSQRDRRPLERRQAADVTATRAKSLEDTER